MIKNYLKGMIGDAINILLAAAAMNLKRMMNKWKNQSDFLFQNYLQFIFCCMNLKNTLTNKMTF
jgi:hypothetical protein